MRLNVLSWVRSAGRKASQTIGGFKVPGRSPAKVEVDANLFERTEVDAANEVAILADIGYITVDVSKNTDPIIRRNENCLKSIASFEVPTTLIYMAGESDAGSLHSFSLQDYRSGDIFVSALRRYVERCDNQSSTAAFEELFPDQFKALCDGLFRLAVSKHRGFIVGQPRIVNRINETGTVNIEFDDPAYAIASTDGGARFRLSALDHGPISLRAHMLAVMRQSWGGVLDIAAVEIAAQFAKEVVGQIPSLTLKHAQPGESINAEGEVHGFIRSEVNNAIRRSRFFQKLVSTPSFGFNYLQLGQLLDTHYANLDRQALFACASNFPKVTWDKYFQAQEFSSEISSATAAYGGLAPLFYPARFLLADRNNLCSPLAIEYAADLEYAAENESMLQTLRPRCRRALCNPDLPLELAMDGFCQILADKLSPASTALLQNRSPRYLAVLLQRQFEGGRKCDFERNYARYRFLACRAMMLADLLNKCAEEGALPPYSLFAKHSRLPRLLQESDCEIMRLLSTAGTASFHMDAILIRQAAFLFNVTQAIAQCQKRGVPIETSIECLDGNVKEDPTIPIATLVSQVMSYSNGAQHERRPSVISPSLLKRLPPMQVRKRLWTPVDIQVVDHAKYRIRYSSLRAAKVDNDIEKGNIVLLLTRTGNFIDETVRHRDNEASIFLRTRDFMTDEGRAEADFNHEHWLAEISQVIEGAQEKARSGYPIICVNETPDTRISTARREGLSIREHVIASNKIALFLEEHFKSLFEKHPVSIAALFDIPLCACTRLTSRRHRTATLVADFRRSIAVGAADIAGGIVAAVEDPCFITPGGKSLLDIAIDMSPRAPDRDSPSAMTFAAVMTALDKRGVPTELFNRSLDTAIGSLSAWKIEQTALRTFATPEQMDTYLLLADTIRTGQSDAAMRAATMRYNMHKALTISGGNPTPAVTTKRRRVDIF